MPAITHLMLRNSSVCSFISEHLGIRIESHRKDETQIELITCQNKAVTLHADDEVIKLFYQEHHRHSFHSLNWGSSKGLDHFTDVCILRGTTHWTLLAARRLNELPPVTRNKRYVACSRARGHIWFFTGKTSPPLQTVSVVNEKISAAAAAGWPRADLWKTARRAGG